MSELFAAAETIEPSYLEADRDCRHQTDSFECQKSLDERVASDSLRESLFHFSDFCDELVQPRQ